MANKRLKTYKRPDGLVKTVVTYDDEYAEYQVLLYRAGKLHEPATYHTDNADDAHGTAQLMVKS